jgi:hypothetical protein
MAFLEWLWIISSVVQKWTFELNIFNHFGHSNKFRNDILVVLQAHFRAAASYTSPFEQIGQLAKLTIKPNCD